MSEQKYKGMTVNERLFSAGLIDEFDAAINQQNEDKAIRILQLVELSFEEAKQIARTLLNKENEDDSN